jgi:poly [ADP-ribose] polymerase
MTEENSSILIEYGRVDHTSTKLTKPLSQWNSIYNSKVKKGYKDVTAYAAETVAITDDKKDDTALASTGMMKVDEFMSLMQQYTSGLVKATYSVTAKQVTQQQVDDAQKVLTELMSMKNDAEPDVNQKLIELYTIIPRKMSKVQFHLLPSIKLEDILDKEQDNLDAMASQVAMQNKADITQVKVDKPVKQTILDSIGITMKEYKGIPKEIQYLTDQCTRNKIEAIFEVNSPVEDKIYDEWLSKQKNKTSRILIHGTKNTSVIPILKTRLQIRPQGNFQFSGKIYGEGSYFSEVVSKSLNYTGYDRDKVLLVYEVHIGNPFIYEGWYKGNSFTLNYKNLQERGFDSTHVNAGNGLLNSEIIAYKEQQYKVRYIIWLK